jgi:hypothetical protein
MKEAHVTNHIKIDVTCYGTASFMHHIVQLNTFFTFFPKISSCKHSIKFENILKLWLSTYPSTMLVNNIIYFNKEKPPFGVKCQMNYFSFNNGWHSKLFKEPNITFKFMNSKTFLKIFNNSFYLSTNHTWK